MPVKTVRIRTSSVSEAEIPEGKGGRVRITLNDKSGSYKADLTDKELRDLVKQLNAEKVTKKTSKKSDAAAEAEAEDANA